MGSEPIELGSHAEANHAPSHKLGLVRPRPLRTPGGLRARAFRPSCGLAILCTLAQQRCDKCMPRHGFEISSKWDTSDCACGIAVARHPLCGARLATPPTHTTHANASARTRGNHPTRARNPRAPGHMSARPLMTHGGGQKGGTTRRSAVAWAAAPGVRRMHIQPLAVFGSCGGEANTSGRCSNAVRSGRGGHWRHRYRACPSRPIPAAPAAWVRA